MPQDQSNPYNPELQNAKSTVNLLRYSIPSKERCIVRGGFGKLFDAVLRTSAPASTVGVTGMRDLSRVSKRAFTLIELLVVIAIISVLAIVVILTLNPAQLLAQSRDSNRLSDLASIQTAVNLLQTDQPGSSLGTTSTVYPSLPDATATSTAGDQCQGLGLPTLPATYAYHCAATSTYRANTNTGWVPVNFASISAGSPLSQLPIDPTNTSSSRLYYTYTTNGSQFELTATMESSKYKLGGSNDAIGTDGGTLATVYEKGSKLGLEPLDYGDSALVGLWTFDEGTGTVAYDYSGNNATGSWSGIQVGTSGYYSAGRIGSSAGAFSSTTAVLASSSALILPLGRANRSLSAWINTSDATDNMDFMGYGSDACSQLDFKPGVWAGKLALQWFCGDWQPSVPSIANATWHYVAFTYDGATVTAYQDGVNVASTPVSLNTGNSGFLIGQARPGWGFTGLMDDVRIYNRALSASEVQALYNGQK